MLSSMVTLQQHPTSISSQYIPTKLSSPPNDNVVVGSTTTVASNESPPQVEQQRLQSMSSSISNDNTVEVGSCCSTNNSSNNNVREEHHSIATTMLPMSSETSAWGNDESLRESKQDSTSWIPANKSTDTTLLSVHHCQPPKHGFTVTLRATDEESSFTFNNTNDTMVTIGNSNTNVRDESAAIINRRPRSGSEGLDYLAFLAEQERRDMMTCEDEEQRQKLQGGGQYQHRKTVVVITPPTSLNHSASSSYNSTNSNAATSDSDDTEMMPPPQPRRPRSISNPDSMMTTMYNSFSSKQQKQQQQHFVLPPHLLKKELAEARGAVVRKAAAMIELDIIQRNNYPIPEHSIYNHNYHADYDNNDIDIRKKYCGRHEEDNNELNRLDSSDEYDDDGDDDEDEEDVEVVDNDYDTGAATNNNENISSAELLRRARSRLLEDLLNESSTSSSINLCIEADGTTKANILLLPHNLSKYKTVYNQNGRIGIYTPQERAAIIERYLAKRMHRNWNKKIRYNCRKSLADRRLRVKGRFVKRSMEIVVAQQESTAAATNSNESRQASIVTNACTTDNDDDIMPDITDPDAGFCPTIDQPYRRLRRHTVT